MKTNLKIIRHKQYSCIAVRFGRIVPETQYIIWLLSFERVVTCNENSIIKSIVFFSAIKLDMFQKTNRENSMRFIMYYATHNFLWNKHSQVKYKENLKFVHDCNYGYIIVGYFRGKIKILSHSCADFFHHHLIH